MDNYLISVPYLHDTVEQDGGQCRTMPVYAYAYSKAFSLEITIRTITRRTKCACFACACACVCVYVCACACVCACARVLRASQPCACVYAHIVGVLTTIMVMFVLVLIS